jgi:hypothetical protein
MPLGIGQILEVGFRWLSAFVTWSNMCFLVLNPFPHSIMIYPTQFKFPYQLPLPQKLQINM